MVQFDIGLDSMMKKAQKLGDEREALEKENKKRAKRGLAPLPDPQDLKDQDASLRQPISSARTMTADEALRRMSMDEDEEDAAPTPPPPKKKAAKKAAKPKHVEESQSETSPNMSSEEAAVRRAEAARRVDDMKHGRINHINNWQQIGVDMGLEGGSDTVIVDHSQIRDIVAGTPASTSEGEFLPKGMTNSKSAADEPAVRTIEIPMGTPVPAGSDVSGVLAMFFQDLYSKLATSFDGLETTLSDLQGRVSEIVANGTYSKPEEYADEGYEQFKEAMAGKTKVTYDINGTRISFDAVKVYLEPPCLTIVTREDAAAVKPKPGSKLRLSYEFEGLRYDNDLVTFLGTSFAVPELGLRFSGFVRDADA